MGKVIVSLRPQKRHAMCKFMKQSATAAVLGLALTVPKVDGQLNPYFQVRPGLTLQQAASNVAGMGQAMQNVPPYALGFNPYRGMIANSGAAAMYANADTNPYMNPYTASMFSNGSYNAYDP